MKLKQQFRRFLPFITFSGLSVGAQALVFITNIVIANKLSSADYGMYSIIISVVNLLLMISVQWHTSMVHYCGSKEIAETGNMQQTNTIRGFLFFVTFTISGVALLIFSDFIEDYIGGSFVLLIYLLVIAKGVSEFFSAYLIARKRIQISAIALFVVQLIVTGYLMIFKADITMIILLQIVSNLIFLLLIPYLYKEDFKLIKVDSYFAKYSVSFALWQLMGTIAIYIISYGDNYIIKNFLTYSDVASYNSVYILFSSVFLASNILANYYIAPLTNALASNNKKKLSQLFKKERIIIFIFFILIHIILIAFAKPILTFLYQGKYDHTVLLFRVLLIASIVRYWTVFEMLFFNSTGKIKVQQFLNVLSAALKVILGVILIQLYGLLGLAISTLLSTIIVGILSFVLSERDIARLCNENSIT